MDLSEYGNPTEHQRGREKKIDLRRRGGHAPMSPPLATPLTPRDPMFIRLLGYQRVTDGQTDGIAVGITALCIAGNAAAL